MASTPGRPPLIPGEALSGRLANNLSAHAFIVNEAPRQQKKEAHWLLVVARGGDAFLLPL